MLCKFLHILAPAHLQTMQKSAHMHICTSEYLQSVQKMCSSAYPHICTLPYLYQFKFLAANE